MLKIIDIDLIKDRILELTFNDGFKGIANLTNIFNTPKFRNIKDFKKFSLTTDGSLKWDVNKISASQLRKITKGDFVVIDKLNVLSNFEDVIKQACWDSIVEKRPDILQGVIRSYVELYGHTKVIQKAGIKSRTSAYKTLKPETKPTFATLVQLGNVIIEIAKDDNKVIN